MVHVVSREAGREWNVLPRKRLLLAVAAAAAVALPAAVLAGLCLGKACERNEQAQGRVPFCSLPQDLRSLIVNGFRDGRSPHILAVAGRLPLTSPLEGTWPSIDTVPDSVPLVFAGTGVSDGAEVPAGTTLDAVAPTLEGIMGLRRPHPGVRSGEAIEGVASGETPRLVVLVALKGVSSRGLERRPQTWPVLRELIEDGAGTLDAQLGSLPEDPSATITTIGTGALPRDHGITGAVVRNEKGRAVEAWSERSPFSVVAALGDDLDEIEGQLPKIGLVATRPSERGLIGGNWYIEHDRDDFVVSSTGNPGMQTAEAERLLASGYGSDPTTDLLAVVMGTGNPGEVDAALGRLLIAAERASGGSFAIAVTSSGPDWPDPSEGFRVSNIEAAVERALGDVIEVSTPGGFHLDQEEMTRTGLSDDRVVNALRGLDGPEGEPLFADVFPAIAVTFARYC